jgi:hypothetical protein
VAVVDGRDHRRGIGFSEQDDLLVRMKIRHDYPACALFRGGRCTCDEASEPVDNPPMPQTPAERQEARRKRLLIGEGRTEVRGIYLPPALHAALKEHAAKLLNAYKPKEK